MAEAPVSEAWGDLPAGAVPCHQPLVRLVARGGGCSLMKAPTRPRRRSSSNRSASASASRRHLPHAPALRRADSARSAGRISKASSSTGPDSSGNASSTPSACSNHPSRPAAPSAPPPCCQPAGDSDRLLAQLAPEGVMREPLDLLRRGGPGGASRSRRRFAREARGALLQQPRYVTSCVSACLNEYSRSGNSPVS